MSLVKVTDAQQDYVDQLCNLFTGKFVKFHYSHLTVIKKLDRESEHFLSPVLNILGKKYPRTMKHRLLYFKMYKAISVNLENHTNNE